jgi:hypothetical protein
MELWVVAVSHGSNWPPLVDTSTVKSRNPTPESEPLQATLTAVVSRALGAPISTRGGVPSEVNVAVSSELKLSP